MYSCSPYWWCLDANYRSSMISSRGASCFGHCKVQSIKKVSLPATSHTASPDCMPSPSQIQLLGTATRFSKDWCCCNICCCSLAQIAQSAGVCPRPALKSQAEFMPSQCCPCAVNCFCPVITSAMVTATCQSNSHGTQCAAGSAHQLPSQLLLAKLMLFRQRQEYLLKPPMKFLINIRHT